MESSPPEPQWFRQAWDTPFRKDEVMVEGCPIGYLEWGQLECPGLVLVHGGLAHAQWWRYLAPLLARHYHVVALDLSGHGESGHRELYPLGVWSREITAIWRKTMPGKKPVVVGHSMGGIMSVPAAGRHGRELAGVIVIDAPLHKPPKREPEKGGGHSFRHIKPYPSLDKAMSRFRFLPHQPCENGYIVYHLARTSLKQTGAGWIWKFDPAMFEELDIEPLEPFLARIPCRWAFFRGEFSTIVPPEAQAYLDDRFGKPRPFVDIPQAHHHLMLDQPLAFIAALRAVLTAWGH